MGIVCGRGRLAREVGEWHGLREGTAPVTRPAEQSSAILWRKNKNGLELRPFRIAGTPSRSLRLSSPSGAESRIFLKRAMPRQQTLPLCTFGVVSSEGMDLTGLEPAPATLAGCCASATPQAHACNGNDETCELHVHPSHRSPGIPEMGR